MSKSLRVEVAICDKLVTTHALRQLLTGYIIISASMCQKRQLSSDDSLSHVSKLLVGISPV